jgi:hypothetical protein
MNTDQSVLDSITTIDASSFSNSVFITLSLKGLSFRRQIRDEAKLIEYLNQKASEIKAKRDAGAEVVDNSMAIEIPAAAIAALQSGKKKKGGVTATKPLLLSPALDALRQHLTDTKNKITAPPQYGGIANPSGIMEGLFELSREAVPMANQIISDARAKLIEDWTNDKGETCKGYLTAFLDDYEAAIGRARNLPILDGGLGPLFNPGDYPSREAVEKAFDIQRRWIALGIPEGLPEELREQAAEELRADLRNAAETIKASMREGLLSLLEHAQETLTVKPGEKAKVIRESCIGNVLQFCEVFSLRNTQGDDQLAALVAEAKATLTGIDPDQCRKLEQVRTEAAAKFATLAAKLDTMIETEKSRRFDLGDN